MWSPIHAIGGRVLGAMEHTRGLPAVILSNAPMGNESPINRQMWSATPKKGKWVLAGEARTRTGFINCDLNSKSQTTANSKLPVKFIVTTQSQTPWLCMFGVDDVLSSKRLSDSVERGEHQREAQTCPLQSCVSEEWPVGGNWEYWWPNKACHLMICTSKHAQRKSWVGP